MIRSTRGAARARIFFGLAVMSAAFLGLLASGAQASPSSASYDYGQAWTTKRIKYYNAAKVWDWSVKQGAKAWNQSGIKRRFVAVSTKSRADVIIKLRDFDGRHNGLATLGMPYQGKGKMWLAPPKDMDPLTGELDMARTATHELGHILGLDHEPLQCAIMNTNSTGSPRCEFPPTGMWRCRFIESADIQRALKIYPGSAAPLTEPRHCFKWDIPAPATEFTATQVDGLVELSWRNPSDVGFWNVTVNRRAGACPTAPEDPDAEFVTNLNVDWGDELIPGRITTVNDYLYGSGTYCYAVWTAEEAGRFNGQAATATIEYTDPYELT